MGKPDKQNLPVVQRHSPATTHASTTFLCQRCALALSKRFSFKCAAVLMLGLAAFLSALFWLLPLHHNLLGFDAKDSIKRNATVQSYFQLQKPVSELIPHISRLEYDVNEEIGVPSLKVAVLSMYAADLSNWHSFSNWTNVVVGFLPDKIDSTIVPVALSLLKSSLIDLFLQQYNLTLTYPIFGKPSSFEILKFPGGISIFPERTPLLSLPLVKFTLNSSIYDIKENLPELKEQLKLGLHLMPNEMVYIKVINSHGSTKSPPTMVEALVASDIPIQPERLKQLAQIITVSPPIENLGLDHSVFGKVKEISLSSFLNHSIHAPVPAPTPSPSLLPERASDVGRFMMPSYSPTPSPNSHLVSSPFTTKSPGPISSNLSPHSTGKSPVAVSASQISPAPLSRVADGFPIPDNRSGKGLMSPQHVSSSYTHSSLVGYSWSIRCLNGLPTLFLLLLWMY